MARKKTRRRRRRTARCKVVTTCKNPRRRVRLCWAKDGKITRVERVPKKKKARKGVRRKPSAGYKRVSKKLALKRDGKLRKGCRAVKGGFVCKRKRAARKRRR